MSLKEKLFDSKVSRRSFLKGMAAVGTTAALYGCGSGGDGAKSYIETDEMPTPPEISGTIVSGAAPHNCGGRCVTKVYVENDTIKRIVTDETPEFNIVKDKGKDLPQMRACIRCRSNRQRFYRGDRILKALKQTGKRGDIEGFEEIDLDKALREIADKLNELKDREDCGPQSFLVHYASGDGNEATNSAACATRLMNLYGGQMAYRNDYSWPSMEHTSWFFFGLDISDTSSAFPPFYFPPAKSRQDAFKADVVIVWSGNFAESIWGTNTAWYLQQLKEDGKEVIIIDSRISQSVVSHASKHIPIMPGTDSALAQAIMHELIVNSFEDYGGDNVKYKGESAPLDIEFILKYTHGFFDDNIYGHSVYSKDDKGNPIPKTYHSESVRENYIVPDGASLSAYIMGDNDLLVRAGINGNTSIYPETIGFNNYNSEADDNPEDYPYDAMLKEARVPMYGQQEKTPEWAEKVTGVPAATIRELAQKFAEKDKKITIWLGGGFQRQSEGEQGPLNVYALGAITGQFGVEGRHVGTHSDRLAGVSFSIAMPKGGAFGEDNPVYKKLFDGEADFPYWSLYNPLQLTDPAHTPMMTWYTFPVFVWPDLAANGGTGKSLVNDGQVKNFPCKISAILNFAGNMLGNQCGDNNQVINILKMKDENSTHPQKYKIELIVTADQFMTTSALYSDYILPVRTAFEKVGACTGWLAGDAITKMNYAVEPPANSEEVLSDYNLCAKLAEKLGIESDFTEGKSEEEWVDEIVKDAIEKLTERNPDKYIDVAALKKKWDEEGFIHFDEKYGTYDALAGYRADPAAHPLATPTGKMEIYSQAMVEDYEARGYSNIDRQGYTLKNDGTLKLAGNYELVPFTYTDPDTETEQTTYIVDWTSEKTTENGVPQGRMARYVYPIPMVIAMLEGHHPEDPKLDEDGVDQGREKAAYDLLRNWYTNNGYTYCLNGWHIYYRSHSTHNNNAYINEVFKRDVNGDRAFLDYEERDYKAGPWDDNVYEPIWINPSDADRLGIQAGDRVVVESPRGSIYASAVVTNRIRPGWLGMGQGAWTNGDNLRYDGTIDFESPDIGGAINVLTKFRPARICQGMTLGADTRVKIYKA